MAKTAITVIAPNQWQRELKANAVGEVSFDKSWGLYLLEVSYVEAVKGKFEGEKYDAVRHVMTLSAKKLSV